MKPLWAKKLSDHSRDEALAAAELSSGLLVVGLHAINDAFAVLFSYSGEAITQTSIPGGILRSVKVRSAGFIAVGQYISTGGLIVTGDELGHISEALLVRHNLKYVTSFDIRDVLEIRDGMFVLIVDFSLVDRSRAMLAVIHMKNHSIQKVMYIGDDIPYSRTYCESIYKSLHGGYTVAGYSKTQFASYQYFMAEITDEFDIPDVGTFMQPADSALFLQIMDVDYLIKSFEFTISDVSGFNSSTISTEIIRNVSTSMPVTSMPSIKLTSETPTQAPTLDPLTASPSNTPRPTEIGETNPPSVDPKVKPTSYPVTPKPTVLSSLRPSSPTMKQPLTSSPLDTSFNPTTSCIGAVTLVPTVAPSLQPLTDNPTVDNRGAKNALVFISIAIGSSALLVICIGLVYLCHKKFSCRFSRHRTRNLAEILRRSNANNPSLVYRRFSLTKDSHRVNVAVESTRVLSSKSTARPATERSVTSNASSNRLQKKRMSLPPMTSDEFYEISDSSDES